MRTVLLVVLAALPLSASLLEDIRLKLSAGDLLSADAIADEYHRSSGDTTEYCAGVAWLARGAMLLHDDDAAARYLAQTKALASALMKTHRVEDDRYLAYAVGTTIEVESRLLANQGKRDAAIALLNREFPRWKLWTIEARIHKNLDLLTLEGSRAPGLDASARGKPTLLFLWAHWCSDCKAEAGVIARIRDKYAPKGLVVMAPTRRYGSIPDNDNPTAEQENRRIEQVWKETYAGLAGVEHPISDETMLAYGVSSTPTLVLIDASGIVRMYRPYRMSDAQLSAKIDEMLTRE